MAGLLVSVRSAVEARAALAGGASVIDVKEPDRGPLGRAGAGVWRDVRRAVPETIPVSIALGELRDWRRPGVRPPGPARFAGMSYRKVGLAGAGPDWEREWAGLRRDWGPGPAWVAVVYADWTRAGSPHPDDVAAAALAADDCAGILVDTWDKSRPSPLAADAFWRRWVDRARARADRGPGRPLLIALAGGLDAAAIARLSPLGPDLFAVRGAACRGGDRRGAVDPGLVHGLVRAASGAAPADVDSRTCRESAR